MSILVLTSDTLIGTPATGNLEYNGQFYGTDSNASRAQMQRITQGTAVASTSGTSISFTNIPAWVKRITVMLTGVSTNGTSKVAIQLGTSGGLITSGYLSNASAISSVVATSQATNQFLLDNAGTAADIRSGSVIFTNISGNTWVSQGVLSLDNTASTQTNAGSVTLSGQLTNLAIKTGNGTDTFDAGTVNIIYEG